MLMTKQGRASRMICGVFFLVLGLCLLCIALFCFHHPIEDNRERYSMFMSWGSGFLFAVGGAKLVYDGKRRA
jgi:threonine/homoserine/homoserine lactone efflux protein